MIREKIVKALIRHLNNIAIKNGFYRDIDGQVFEWLGSPIAQFPAIIVRDVKDEIITKDRNSQHTLVFEIDILESGESVPILMRELIYDVLKAIRAFRDETNYEVEVKEIETIAEQRDRSYIASRVDMEVKYYSREFEI